MLRDRTDIESEVREPEVRIRQRYSKGISRLESAPHRNRVKRSASFKSERLHFV